MRGSWKLGALFVAVALALGFLATCTSSSESPPPLTVTITTPSASQSIAAGSAVTFTGSATGGSAPYTYAWDFDSTSLGAGPAPATGASPGAVTFYGANPYVVKLTVTDAASATASTTVTITVNAASGALSAANAVGSWVMTCVPDDTFVDSGSRREVLRFTTGGTYTNLRYLWSANDYCGGSPQAFLVSSGPVALYGTTTSTPYGPATQAVLNSSVEAMTLYDSGLVSTFNGDGAFGYTNWAKGQPQDVLGRDYSGTRPTTMNVLVMRQGDVFFVNPDDAVGDAFPTTVQPRFTLVSNDPVTATAVHSANVSNEWTGPCIVDSDSDYNATARLDRFDFNTDVTPTAITFTSTYYWNDSPNPGYACDTAVGAAVVQAVETWVVNASFGAGATVLTDRGLATPVDGTVTAHSIKPYTAGAQDALNAALVYGVNTYLAGNEQSIPVDAAYDGSTGSSTQRLSAILQGSRLYMGGDNDRTDAPVDAIGYPRFSGSVTYLPRLLMSNVGDSVGNSSNFVTGCMDVAGAGYNSWTRALRIFSNGQINLSDTTYANTGCTGAIATIPELTNVNNVIGDVVTGLHVPRGYATGVGYTDGGQAYCMVLMHVGDRMYWSPPVAAAGALCAAGDFAAFDEAHGLPQMYGGLEVDPVGPATIPPSSWRRACRNTGGTDWRDAVQMFGTAGSAGFLLNSYTVDYDTTDGSCTGTATYSNPETQKLVISDYRMNTDYGLDFTLIDLQDSSGAVQEQQVMTYFSADFWTGDENGAMAADGYPAVLLPGVPFHRIQ